MERWAIYGEGHAKPAVVRGHPAASSTRFGTLKEWSASGTRIAYTVGLDDGSWQIATMGADGDDVQVLTAGSGIHEVPTWSPDGTWLAYGYSPDLPGDPSPNTPPNPRD